MSLRASNSQGGENLEKESKRARTQGKLPDRLSDLPECLIVQILSLLGMKDAVKTSLLSKRWKLLWTNVDSIVYDFFDSDQSNKSIKEFVSFIDHTLMQSTCLKIKRFALLELGNTTYSNKSLVHQLVDKWISFVLERNVEDLTLDLQNMDYSAPDCLYRSSSLVTLVLQGVRYDLVPPQCTWTSIKRLSLVNMVLEDEDIAKILEGCPQLEDLFFDEIYGLSHLNIMSPRVRRLGLSNIEYRNDEGDFFRITAPWIREFDVTGFFLIPQCQLVDVSSVANVTLNFYWGTGTNDFEAAAAGYDYNLWWINMIMDFLNILCKVDTLTIYSEIVQALAVSKLLGKTYPVFKCKHLTISSPLFEPDIYGIACLLQSTPCLETLCIRVPDFEDHDIMYYTGAVFGEKDMLHSLPEGKLMHLKNIEVDYLRTLCMKSPSHLDDTLVKYVLKSSCILERLVIIRSSRKCKQCWGGCVARHADLLASNLFETFLDANEDFVFESKRKNSRLEFSFPNYVCGMW